MFCTMTREYVSDLVLKEFGFGFYDGISGLVTQPLDGAKKEGFSGFAKGFGKGIGGLVLKPAAGESPLARRLLFYLVLTGSSAIWGLPGYTFKGLYKELVKRLGSSVQNYIIAARVAQGYEDLKVSAPEERYDIVARWQALHAEAASKQSKPTSFQSSAGEANSSGQLGSAAAASFSTGESEDKVFDDAIKESVAATSTGNPEEDEWIARAIKASVSELRRSTKEENGEKAMQRAIDASLAEASRPRSETQAHPSAQDSHKARSDEDHKSAMQQSLSAQSEPQPYGHGGTDDAQVDTDDDENVKQALEQSKQDSCKDRADSIDADLSKALADSLRGSTEADLARSKADEEERIVLEYVKRQSALEEQHRKNAGT